MKKVIIFIVFLFTALVFRTEAQVRVNINIGSQPVWGPPGYDYAQYYYLPDIDAYYSVPQRQFIYPEGNRWVYADALPPRYGNYDLYHSYKVVLNEDRPYLRDNEYREKYAQYRGRRDQEVIRDRHEEKYWQIKDHPEHNKWKGDRDDRGRGDRDKHERDDHRDGDHGRDRD